MFELEFSQIEKSLSQAKCFILLTLQLQNNINRKSGIIKNNQTGNYYIFRIYCRRGKIEKFLVFPLDFIVYFFLKN